MDPYAKTIFFPPTFERCAAMRPGSNAGKAPLGLLPVYPPDFDWGNDRRLRHESDTIIYELHVKGFTKHPSSGVPAERQGTYSGVIDKIPYLQQLGVTAVELMSVFQYDLQEGNYWGVHATQLLYPAPRLRQQARRRRPPA
jgi:glycogen operon protein